MVVGVVLPLENSTAKTTSPLMHSTPTIAPKMMGQPTLAFGRVGFLEIVDVGVVVLVVTRFCFVGILSALVSFDFFCVVVPERSPLGFWSD